MSVQYPLVQVTASAPLASRATFAEEVWKFVRAKPLGAAGAAVILVMLIVAFLAEALAPYDPYKGDYFFQFARPSMEHWLGTDDRARRRARARSHPGAGWCPTIIGPFVTMRTEITDTRAKQGRSGLLGIVVQERRFTNQLGQLCAVLRTTLIRR